ncbi:major facilitator superfamily MFS_1 [Sphingobium chlorophenolicum L-1]|uniref:Major facilitator superfamily MFS_1 n=1 Tax=Sphingobium chlorophenolicum L-1 TaxID=690566 RepID=F6F256_SPHCR|nr:MFS transporter [Sphingobium chlorophenolicum]AEG50556.1 major facilitator superfamily MFS_1 [Sphingobium chlorophenolicum L-1]
MSGGAPIDAVRTGSGAEAAVGAALDGITSARLRIVPPLLLGFIMLFDSWDSIAIAYVMPSLTREWHLTPVAAGSLISAGYAGQFVGAILLGSLAERFGRMPVFLASVVWMGSLAIFCALTPDYGTLFALRVVQGVAIGGALPVSITYINEIAPSATRGRYFGIFQFITMAGYAAASFSSTVVIPYLGWRWLFAFGATPLLLLPVVVMLLPESPRWLVRSGRVADAARALRKFGDPTADPQAFHAAGSTAGPAPRLPATVLFSPEFRRRTTVVMLLWFFTSFASFGLTTWLPSIYVSVFHIPVATALRYSATASLLFLVLAPTIALVIDSVGRRPLAIGGSLIATCALLTLGFTLPKDVMILVPLVIAGQLSIFTGSIVLWPYTAETYPTHVRAVALGLSSSLARGASTLTPVVVGAILASGASVAIIFGIFGLCAAGALILWVTATKETARMRLDAI